MDKSEYIRNALLDLGAPSISLEEMHRLCKGPLGDALLFMAEHMRGRSEVNQARTAIQQYVVSIENVMCDRHMFLLQTAGRKQLKSCCQQRSTNRVCESETCSRSTESGEERIQRRRRPAQ